MNVTTDPGWKKKTIWMRDLAKAGPVLMQFTHGVVPSKFEGRIPFAPFRLLNSTVKYALQVENEQLEGWLRDIPIMAWVIVWHTEEPQYRFQVTPLEGPPQSNAPGPPIVREPSRRPVSAFTETAKAGSVHADSVYVICDDGAVFLGEYQGVDSTLLDSWLETQPIPGTPRAAQLAGN